MGSNDVHGPAAGLDALAKIRGLENYHLFHAVCGTLEAEHGNFASALAHFRAAEKLAGLPSEKVFLAAKICAGAKQL